MFSDEWFKANLRYDPETGLLWWKVRGPHRIMGRPAGSKKSGGYISISFMKDGVRKTITAHRLAWLLHHGEWPPRQLDHIDLDTSNNRLCNLRLATPRQNAQNRGLRKDNSTGAKGVYRTRGKRYRAGIRINGALTWLGTFDTVEEAAAVYWKAAQEHFGAFARSA